MVVTHAVCRPQQRVKVMPLDVRAERCVSSCLAFLPFIDYELLSLSKHGSGAFDGPEK